jgi:hypothetical protein
MFPNTQVAALIVEALAYKQALLDAGVPVPVVTYPE